jgi:carbon monoxide dehydrogenase subunit G
MADGMHQVKLNLSVDQVFRFIRDMNNWAPLVPGYQDHVMVNDQESIWKIHGDLGVIERTVSLQVTITEWAEPTNVHFQVTTLNGTCTGEGYFKAKPIADSETEMTGFLRMQVSGIKGALVNPVLKTLLPKAGRDFTEAVAYKMQNARLVAK